jgi:hypothetical protein
MLTREHKSSDVFQSLMDSRISDRGVEPVTVQTGTCNDVARLQVSDFAAASPILKLLVSPLAVIHDSVTLCGIPHSYHNFHGIEQRHQRQKNDTAGTCACMLRCEGTVSWQQRRPHTLAWYLASF